MRRVAPSPLVALLLATILGASACSKPPAEEAPKGPPPEHAAWTTRANIYEVNIRQYTPEGTFKAFERELPRLRQMGVDILWVMPLQPIGELNRKGSLGSYYSIRDYRGINPEFGTAEDLKSLITTAHGLGLKVILDWVANHTSFDHAWTKEHPDWYTRRADGSISMAVDNNGKETDWSDVADLNYGNAEMRAEMLRTMQWWIREYQLDGFRCDVAGFVPYDFWTQVSDSLRAMKPDVFLLAEWEDPKLHPAFDMTYGWELHHLLNGMAKGQKRAVDLKAYLDKQHAEWPANAYRMYFTSSHDENSWNGSEFERMGKASEAGFVVAATFEGGMPMVYSGQEASLSKRLRFFDKDTIPWPGTNVTPFYSALLALKHDAPALANGAAGGRQQWLAADSGASAVAYLRSADTSHVVVFANFGAKPVSVAYKGLTAAGAFREIFSGATDTLRVDGAVSLPAFGYKVYRR